MKSTIKYIYQHMEIFLAVFTQDMEECLQDFCYEVTKILIVD